MDTEIKKEMMLIEHDENSSSYSEHVSDTDERNSLSLKEVNVPIINAVEFCTNILSRNGQGTFVQLACLQSYKDIAANEIKFIISSKKNLMKLLCKFPLVFHVTGDKVKLRNWIIFHLNQQEWLKELLTSSFRLVPIYISTVQFYCNELFKITPGFELTIRQLFGHKSKAPRAVQAVTRNNNEFVIFLQMCPEIFHFKDDKVMLSKSAVSYRSLETWIRRLCVADFTLARQSIKETISDNTLCGTKFYDILKNEVAVYESVGFYYKIMLTNGCIKGLSQQKLLSKNNRVVPLSTFIKNIVDLEIFISSYPEVFTLINKTVFLSELLPGITHNEFTSEREDQLNCSVSKEDDFDQENNDQIVISFYQSILNNISNLPGVITEFPINHLVYYNVIAPPEVRKIAKNAKVLKNFLSKYPQIFSINTADNVVFGKTDVSVGAGEISTFTVCSKITDQRIFEEKLKKAVSFYKNIIYDLGGTAKIERLLNYRLQTSKEVQSITTNFEELKKFFCSQQNDFTVVNDSVCLTDKHKGDFEVNALINLSKSDATKNAVSFYSNVLKKQKSQIVSLIKISGHRGSATADVQSVAKNPKELKIFFSQFPEVFTVVDNNVKLSKPIEKFMIMEPQQQTLPPKMFCNDSEQGAVEFFYKMLSNYGTCRVLSINKLFELKLKSSPAIQKISGSNINQFLAFLMKYPQEFLVTNDNVIARKKIPKWSYSGKYENKKFTDPLLLLIFNFFKKYTSNKSLFHIDHLYHNVGRFFVYNDETPVFPSKSDLLLFLGLYPHIFFVDYSRIINVIASGRRAYISSFERRQSKFKNESISRTKTPELSKPIDPNSKSPHNLSSNSLEVETKPLNDGIEGKNSSKVKTNKKGVVKQVKKQNAPQYRIRNKRKTNVFPVVKSSFSEESLVSELSKNYDEIEAEINSSNVPRLEDHFWNNNDSLFRGNDYEGDLPKIEEIENNIISQFICKVNKNYNLPKNNEDLSSSHSGIILNHSFRCTVSSTFPKDFSGREDFDALIMGALLFLNGKLWEEGNLKIMKIEELFNSFSQAVLEMNNCCCKNIKEFKNFLGKFTDHFIISQNYVMPRKNKIEKASYLLNNEEESLPIALFNFLNLYTKQFNFILLKHLYSRVVKYFFNRNRSPFFKTLGDLVLFLEMFPTVFCIDNNQIKNLAAPKENIYHQLLNKFNSGIIKIDSFLDKMSCSSVTNEKHPSVPESTEGWKDYVLQKTLIIEDLGQCQVVTAEILNSQKVIALDCEGVNLGAAGILTLLQIALVNGQVYIFDIIKETSMVNDGGLKDILESESILKVIHDSRNDVANLYTEYAVNIRPIFDTRIVHHLIVNQGVSYKKIPSKPTAIGFNELCSKYGAHLNVQKDEMKDVYKYNRSYWMSRPLTKNMLAYAALDVASLLQIFYTMLKLLKGIPEKSLWELSEQHSLSVLNNKNLLFD